jgi:hypothetical protein
MFNGEPGFLHDFVENDPKNGGARRGTRRSGNAKKSLSVARPTSPHENYGHEKAIAMVAIGPNVGHHRLAFLAL